MRGSREERRMEENYHSRNTNNDPQNVEKLSIYYVIIAYYNLIKNNCLLFLHHRGGNSVSDKEINNDFVDANLMFSKARQWPEGGVWIRGFHLASHSGMVVGWPTLGGKIWKLLESWRNWGDFKKSRDKPQL